MTSETTDNMSEQSETETKETLVNEAATDIEAEEKEENVEELDPTIKLAKEAQEFKEKYFYLAAEMDNLKKRFDKEKESIVKYGTENILRDLIDVQDNFGRTLNALRMDQDEKMKNVVFGIDMVAKQFSDILENYGLKTVNALGKEFDPNFHEAIGRKLVDGAKDMEIVEVQLDGYTLNGRLVREAKVIVNQEEE